MHACLQAICAAAWAFFSSATLHLLSQPWGLFYNVGGALKQMPAFLPNTSKHFISCHAKRSLEMDVAVRGHKNNKYDLFYGLVSGRAWSRVGKV